MTEDRIDRIAFYVIAAGVALSLVALGWVIWLLRTL